MNQKPVDFELVPAKKLSSLKIGTGNVRHLSITNLKDLPLLHRLSHDGEVLHITGRGTNSTFGRFSGIVVSIDISGYSWLDDTTLTINAGEDWQVAVDLSVGRGLCGIERLTQIPGSIGAAPIQNIGAFGQILSDKIAYIHSYDYLKDTNLTLRADECGFGSHRASNFKDLAAWQTYVITAITLRLEASSAFEPPTGEGLTAYAQKHSLSAVNVSEAEKLIRGFRKTLYPDYHTTPNCGSYFTNYEIDNELARTLPAEIWTVKHRDARGGSATLFQCKDLLTSVGIGPGFVFKGGLMMHPTFNNFLINTKEATAQDLLDCHEEVNGRLFERYGIRLVPEPYFVDDATKRRVV